MSNGGVRGHISGEPPELAPLAPKLLRSIEERRI